MERDWPMNRINIIKNAKSIKMKILYSFIIFLLIVWGYAVYNYFQNEKLMEDSQDIINEETNILSITYQLSNSIDVRLAAVRGYVLTGDSNYKNTFASYSEKSLDIQQSLQQYDAFKEIEKESKQTHTSSETYHTISVAVTEMVSSIKNVSQNLQHIANNTSDIDSAIENIAAVSEQSAASSQQTAATIQEVASSMESVAQNADQLNSTADKLQQVVQQFKL